MRWITFAVVAYVAIALEKGLMDALAFHGLGSIRPSLVAVLLVFIALNGPRHAVLWSAFILGILMDLCVPLEDAAGQVRFIIGPYALGYVFASYLVLQARPLVLRRRVLTQAVLASIAVLAAGVVAVAIFTVRSWYPEVAEIGVRTSGLDRLLWHGGSGLFTALLAFPVGWAFNRTSAVWSFQSVTPRATNWR